MNAKHQIVIVGAGIFGATAALELAQRGHRVTLLNPGPLPHPDASSTDISKVIRMDYGADEFYMALMEEAFAGWDAWNALWEEPLYHQTGFLLLTQNEMKPGGFEYESYQLLQKRGHRAERLNPARLATRFPAWNADCYADGYYNPRAGWAESGRVVSQVIQMAQQAGLNLQAGEKFARLIETDSRVSGVITTAGHEYRADFVIVSAGAWTPVLLPHLAEVMWPIGQPVLHLRPKNWQNYRPPYFVPWGADISNTGWYGFSALADGTLKVANHGPGIPIHPDEPRRVPAEAEAHFREFARQSLPELVDAPLIATRLCLYCDTWDGDFWIDRDPNRPGLIVSTGGSGHGFKFAPVLGKITADILENKTNPYAQRFAWRNKGDIVKEEARFMAR